MSGISCSFRAALVALVLGGCGASGPLVAERLDPVTGVTTTRSTVPLILYRDDSAHAAHARDFVYVGPVEVNRMGSFRYFLWFGIWSTLQGEISRQRDGFESIVVYADGEPLQLELAGWTADRIGLSEPVYPKPVATAADAYYEVTLDQVRLIAHANEIRLHADAGGSYEPWNGQTAAMNSLAAFVETVR